MSEPTPTAEAQIGAAAHLGNPEHNPYGQVVAKSADAGAVAMLRALAAELGPDGHINGGDLEDLAQRIEDGTPAPPTRHPKACRTAGTVYGARTDDPPRAGPPTRLPATPHTRPPMPQRLDRRPQHRPTQTVPHLQTLARQTPHPTGDPMTYLVDYEIEAAQNNLLAIAPIEHLGAITEEVQRRHQATPMTILDAINSVHADVAAGRWQR